MPTKTTKRLRPKRGRPAKPDDFIQFAAETLRDIAQDLSAPADVRFEAATRLFALESYEQYGVPLSLAYKVFGPGL